MIILISSRTKKKYDGHKKKNRQHNDHKKKNKKTNNGLENTAQKTKDCAPWTPLKQGMNSCALEG